MTLQTWEQLHKDSNMKKKVKFLLNIGTNDLQQLSLEKAYKEGDVVQFEDVVADKLISKRFAIEYDEAFQKAEAEELERLRDEAVQAAIPAAEREAVNEAAKAEATKRVKSGARSPEKVETPATPTKVSEHPHVPKPEKS